MKIGLLIPCTSKNRPSWKTIKDSYLYTLSINTFVTTMDKEHEYVYYIGHDDGDRIYGQQEEHKKLEAVSSIFSNIAFKYISFKDIKKGHVTKMWNVLFEEAYNDGCNYFFQCGDDIHFKTKGWINACIQMLKKHNDIGLTGPINNNSRILTQSFVSRKHMDIFGYYMPEEIINWCCDDWYNEVYKPQYFYPLKQHFCSNEGGNPRYTIDNNDTFRINFQNNLITLRQKTSILAMNDKKKIKEYIETLS